MPDGRALITGGFDRQAHYLATAEIFDPATARFAVAGNPTVPRADHTAVVLADGRIAFIGGTSTGWTVLDSIEIYDPKTGEFSEAGRMSVPRMSHTSVLLSDGRIFIAGGRTGRGSTARIYDSTEIFDPRTGRSQSSAIVQTRRHKHDAVALADSRVVITGGSDEHDSRGRYDSAEIFDPARNAFVSATKMHMARYKHRGSSLLLPNGKVPIAGGATQAEMYDPATNAFSLVAGESRLQGHYPAVAPLPARRVLITGGYASPESPSRSAWIYQFQQLPLSDDGPEQHGWHPYFSDELAAVNRPPHSLGERVAITGCRGSSANSSGQCRNVLANSFTATDLYAEGTASLQ